MNKYLIGVAVVATLVIVWLAQTNMEAMGVCQQSHSFETCHSALNK